MRLDQLSEAGILTSSTTTSMQHSPLTPASSSCRYHQSFLDHDPDQYHEQFHDYHQELLQHRDYLPNLEDAKNSEEERLASPQLSDIPSPPPPPNKSIPLRIEDTYYNLNAQPSAIQTSKASEYSNLTNYSNLAALSTPIHPNHFDVFNYQHRSATLPANLSPRQNYDKILQRQNTSPRKYPITRPGSSVNLSEFPRLIGYQRTRISDPTLDVNRIASAREIVSPSLLRSPYSCLLLSAPPESAIQPQQVVNQHYVSSLPRALGIGAASSGICICNHYLNGSATSVVGLCPLHGGRGYSHSQPTPPPRKPANHSYPDISDVSKIPDVGEDVKYWSSNRDDNTSEDAKEDNVKDILMR